MLNYTTTVAAAKTVAQMQALLGKHGARAVVVRYESNEPSALSFTMETPTGERAFTLPVNVGGVLSVLRKTAPARYRSPEHATRVAWRIAKDWLEAQLAIVEAHMATLDQVMLPYLHVDGETTMYQAFLERQTFAIEASA